MGQFTDEIVNELGADVRNGYSVDLEAEADERSMEICNRAGYDPKALVEVLHRFESNKGKYGGGQYPENRQGLAQAVLQRIGGAEGKAPLEARTERYKSVQILLVSCSFWIFFVDVWCCRITRIWEEWDECELWDP